MSKLPVSAGDLAEQGIEAQKLAQRMLAIQADAGLTIAMRMPILFGAAMGNRRGQREAQRAVTEKMSAAMESGFAAAAAGGLFWLGVAMNPLAPLNLSEATAKVVNSSLEPFSRRTRANASRLGRRR